MAVSAKTGLLGQIAEDFNSLRNILQNSMVLKNNHSCFYGCAISLIFKMYAIFIAGKTLDFVNVTFNKTKCLSDCSLFGDSNVLRC